METLIAPFAQYGLGGLIIGWLMVKDHYREKAKTNGMMTVIKENTKVMTEVKGSIDSNTKALERLERQHDRN